MQHTNVSCMKHEICCLTYKGWLRLIFALDGDGTCAMLKWAHFEYPGKPHKNYFQIHFVWNFRKYAAYETKWPCGKMEWRWQIDNRRALRTGRLTSPWLDYRLVFVVKDLRDYTKLLQGVDYHITTAPGRRSLFYSVGAITLELVQLIPEEPLIRARLKA